MPVLSTSGQEEAEGHPTHLPTTPIQKKPRLPPVAQFAACPDIPCPAMPVLGPKLTAGNCARRPCLLSCYFWIHLAFPWCLYETTIAILLCGRGWRRGRLSSLNSSAWDCGASSWICILSEALNGSCLLSQSGPLGFL